MLKNQIKQLGVNDGRNLLHSCMRTAAKERVPNNKSEINESDKQCDKKELDAENNRNRETAKWINTSKVG